MAESAQIKELAPQHHALVEFILCHMHERGWRKLACQQFGFTRAWLSIVTRSDVFREEFNRRLTEHNSQVTRELAALRVDVARKAYTKLSSLLDDDDIDDRLVHDIARDTVKGLGLSPSPGAAPEFSKTSEYTREETREVSPGVLERARVTYKKVLHGEEVAQLPANTED